MAFVAPETREILTGIASAHARSLEHALGLREVELERSGLDPRTFALVRVAVLIALDAPPACYTCQVAAALDDGASAEDILGVIRAVAPQVGGPKVVAAATEVMAALAEAR